MATKVLSGIANMYPQDMFCCKRNKNYNLINWNINTTNDDLEFVCVEVLQPSQPNGVMWNAVSLPNDIFTKQA